MKQVSIFGIKNCSTMKKAMTWLEEQSIEFIFHDYKKQAIDEESLRNWLTKADWDQLINKRGTTWRKLTDEEKTDVNDEKAIQLMLTNTSLIKRPLLIVNNEELHLGFNTEQYEQIFSSN